MFASLVRRSRPTVLVLGLFSACASGQGRCGSEPPGDTGGATGGATGGVTGGEPNHGEIDDPEVAALDRDVVTVLDATYGQARRSVWRREAGATGAVFTLEYALGRAHARADLARLQSGLSGRGFSIDSALDDPATSTVFANRQGVPLIVAVDVGQAAAIVTVQRMAR